MANGIRTGNPPEFNKGRSSKFCEGSRVDDSDTYCDWRIWNSPPYKIPGTILKVDKGGTQSNEMKMNKALYPIDDICQENKGDDSIEVKIVWGNQYNDSRNTCLLSCLFACLGFYGISTFVGYLMPSPFYTNKQFFQKFHFSISTQFNYQTIQFSVSIVFVYIQFNVNFKQFSFV